MILFTISGCPVDQAEPVLICLLSLIPDPADKIRICIKSAQTAFSVKPCDSSVVILNLNIIPSSL